MRTCAACIVPRPGKEFIICDLSQIEPRVLAWLCGDTVLLDQLANGVPLYEAHARATMGWTGGNLKKENAELYSLAKARVLGLGYGCGAAKIRRGGPHHGRHHDHAAAGDPHGRVVPLVQPADHRAVEPVAE